MGFSVKLDTNGFFPDRLSAILEEGLVDYVAMDIKNTPEKYPLTCGVPTLDMTPVETSIRLLCQSGVDFEFRTTLIREFHTREDLLSIGRWLEGSPRYFLQAFVDSGNLVGSGCSAFTPGRKCTISPSCSSPSSRRSTSGALTKSSKGSAKFTKRGTRYSCSSN